MAKPQTVLSSDAVKGIQADDFLPWVTAISKPGFPPPSPQHPPGLSYSCFICLSSPSAAGRVLQVCCPQTTHSRASYYLFVFICGCLGGQGHPLLTTGQTRGNATLCVPQGRFLDLIVSGECCAQVLVYQSPLQSDWNFKMPSNPDHSMTLFPWKRENLSAGRGNKR